VFHYTKSFGTLATDYGVQEGSGFPNLWDGIVPVTVVDDASEFVTRTYATYFGTGSAPAVTALYALTGIYNPGPNVVRVDAAPLGSVGATSVYMRGGIADLVTANATAVVATGWARGQVAVTAQILNGTTTVAAPVTNSALIYDGTDVQDSPRWLSGKPILRPGEYLWFEATNTNVLFFIGFVFTELQISLPPNPVAQT